MPLQNFCVLFVCELFLCISFKCSVFLLVQVVLPCSPAFPLHLFSVSQSRLIQSVLCLLKNMKTFMSFSPVFNSFSFGIHLLVCLFVYSDHYAYSMCSLFLIFNLSTFSSRSRPCSEFIHNGNMQYIEKKKYRK
jgi:hypothetical protein